MAVAIARLGLVKRDVGMLHQDIGGGSVVGVGANSDAQLDPNCDIVERHRLVDRGPDPPRGVPLHPVEHQAEQCDQHRSKSLYQQPECLNVFKEGGHSSPTTLNQATDGVDPHRHEIQSRSDAATVGGRRTGQ